MPDGLPVRKNIRLKNYDYSKNGAYFVTYCVKDMRELLWDDVGAHSVCPKLSGIGAIVETSIANIPIVYPNISVDIFAIMPNHVHIILMINGVNDGQAIVCDGRTMCAPTISRVIKHCKEYVTKQIGLPIWQRSFIDRIIRNEDEYKKIWKYIDENPAKWNDDCYCKKQLENGFVSLKNGDLSFLISDSKK